MESDKKEDLFARRDFILNSSIDLYQCAILTPLPGTVLFQKMQAQNRIVRTDFPGDWTQYDCHVATLDTPNLDHRETNAIMHEIWLSLYNKETMRRKMFRTLRNTRSFRTAYWAYAANHNYGRMFLENIFHTDPEGVDEKIEWKNRKRSLYLNVTDKVIWFIYLLAWKKMVRRFQGK